MKKIFTLIAAAFVAASVNAQSTTEVLKFTQGGTYTDNQELTTANTTLILGDDRKTNKWTDVAKYGAALESDYFAALLQTGLTNKDGNDISGTGYVAINGGQNPKDKISTNTSSAGSGMNWAEGKTVGNLPQSGTYFILKTAKAGKVSFGIVLSAEKAFYLADATDATPDDANTLLQIALPAANLKNYVLKDAAGTTVETTDASDGKGGAEVAEKLIGVLEFNAEANHTYYIFCTGSKLGSFGYTFTPSTETAIDAVATEVETADAPAYNLQGQPVDESYRGVVIQNGRKVVRK